MSVTTPDLPHNVENDESAGRARKAPSQLIKVGNLMLALSVLGILVSTVCAYTHSHYFSFSTQLAAHIGIVVFAGTLKLGYVVRLSGFRQQAMALDHTQARPHAPSNIGGIA